MGNLPFENNFVNESEPLQIPDDLPLPDAPDEGEDDAQGLELALETAPTSTLESALGYARAGWPVFPCCPEDKRPYTAHGFKNASVDEETIR